MTLGPMPLSCLTEVLTIRSHNLSDKDPMFKPFEGSAMVAEFLLDYSSTEYEQAIRLRLEIEGEGYQFEILPLKPKLFVVQIS